MLWIFSQGNERIRIEKRYDEHTGELLLIVERRGAPGETRRFADARALRGWLSTFAQQLVRRQIDTWLGSSQQG